MDEDEEYVAPVDGVEDEDDEIEDLDEAWEDENQPAVPEDEGEISDYADENESESEDEESDEEEEDGKKKKKKKKRKGKLDDWQAKPEEELNIKPYKMADKYARARAQVESMYVPLLSLPMGLFQYPRLTFGNYHHDLLDSVESRPN